MGYAAGVFGAFLGTAVIGLAGIEPATATPAPQAIAFEVASVKPAVEPEPVWIDRNGGKGGRDS